MATKSEVVVLDVLHKNETIHADMVDIMKETQSYLGDKCHGTFLSGSDQVTCERQRCSQQHMMDADTRSGRLELLEPCVEDWHCLLSILGVRAKIHTHVNTCTACTCTCTFVYMYTVLYNTLPFSICVYSLYLDHMEVHICRQFTGPWYLVASVLSAWKASTSKSAEK